jgi:hypothetical protein
LEPRLKQNGRFCCNTGNLHRFSELRAVRQKHASFRKHFPDQNQDKFRSLKHYRPFRYIKRDKHRPEILSAKHGKHGLSVIPPLPLLSRHENLTNGPGGRQSGTLLPPLPKLAHAAVAVFMALLAGAWAGVPAKADTIICDTSQYAQGGFVAGGSSFSCSDGSNATLGLPGSEFFVTNPGNTSVVINTSGNTTVLFPYDVSSLFVKMSPVLTGPYAAYLSTLGPGGNVVSTYNITGNFPGFDSGIPTLFSLSGLSGVDGFTTGVSFGGQPTSNFFASVGETRGLSATPLPGTWILFATGLGCLGLFGAMRKRQSDEAGARTRSPTVGCISDFSHVSA